MTLEQYLQQRYSKSTLSSNLYNIKRFTDYYGKKSETATYQDVLDYIGYLRKNRELHPKTLRNSLYGVKIYFNYLIATGLRMDHPCSELYLKDKINKQVQVDTLYSLQRLEAFFDTYQIKSKKHLELRNKIIISLLLYQALTVHEIASLEVKNINLEQCEIFIAGSHHQRSRTLPIQAKQVLLLYRYLEQNRELLLQYNKQKTDSGVLLLGQYGERINPHSISKMINEGQGQNKFQPMKIRQSVIAELLRRENDVRVVQVFSGHKRVSTTQQYKQTQLEILQKALNRFHPLQ